MSQASSPVPLGAQEEEMLQLYFKCLSQFAFDKAKDIMDKEREAHKSSFASSWTLLVHTLSQFAVAEKAYNSLGFLEQKWFGRSSRDTLRNSYQLLMQELRRIDDTVRQQEAMVLGLTSPTVEFEQLLAHLCGQLCEYIRARQKTMDFFEQISTMGTNKNLNYQDLMDVISEITHFHSKNFHHPILASLKSGFTSECDSIKHLLHAQILMCHGDFLASLLQLHQAHSKLTSWGSAAQAKETTKKSMFGTSSKTVSLWPALYQWLLRFKTLLVAKFSLYFYDVLSRQTSPVDMKALSAKNCEDYVAKVITFQKRTDATSVSFVLDTQALKQDAPGSPEHVYKGPGYHHPDKEVPPPTGLDSYPTIFSYPSEYPVSHKPNVVMMINDTNNEPDKVHYIYDKGVQSTYFITGADVSIYIVVIYETKKSEKDSHVNNFMLELSSMLRCMKHFASLKPGSRVGSSRK